MDSAPAIYQQILERELQKRQRANTRYSLRAFSQYLKVDVGDLSKIMRGKKPLSLKRAHALCHQLELSPREQEMFLASLAKPRVSLQSGGVSINFDSPVSRQLDSDMFQIIADLYHYAILEMTHLRGGLRDANEVAKYLGITVIEAQMAVSRLLRLGLLKIEKGRLVKVDQSITTKDKASTSSAHRHHQRQVLRGALRSLERDSIDKRSITSMTMTIDPDKIGTAKNMIQEFMESLCVYLEEGERTATYQLGVNLYPLKGSFKS